MVSRNAALWLLSACFRGETQAVAYLVPLISLSMHLRCTSIIHLLAQCDSVPAYLSKRSTGIIPVVSVNRLAKNETLFSVHVPYGVPKANYCRSPIPIRPVTYVRVHRNNSGAAGSACEYAHHHHHHHLGCQKTRWHLKERSRGQEASLTLPKRPYREMRFPSPFLFPSTRPYYLLRATSLLHRASSGALFLLSLLWQSRDHPSAAASAASLRLPSPSALRVRLRALPTTRVSEYVSLQVFLKFVSVEI